MNMPYFGGYLDEKIDKIPVRPPNKTTLTRIICLLMSIIFIIEMMGSGDIDNYHREMVTIEVKCLDKITSHIEALPSRQSISESVFESLSNEINTNIDKLNQILSQLQLLTISQPKVKQELTQDRVDWHKQQIQHIRTTLRKLTINKTRQERDCGDTPIVRRRRKKGLNAESEVIQSLEDTRRMLATQLRHSEDTFEALVHSSSTLEGVNNELEGIGGSVETGKYLVNMLRNKRFKSRVKITIAMVVFILTCVNILLKRLFPFLYPF